MGKTTRTLTSSQPSQSSRQTSGSARHSQPSRQIGCTRQLRLSTRSVQEAERSPHLRPSEDLPSTQRSLQLSKTSEPAPPLRFSKRLQAARQLQLASQTQPKSPLPNCAICQSNVCDKCYTNSCTHYFCFPCLVQWSKLKAECPLCKKRFNTIYHNLRSASDYDVYKVKTLPPIPGANIDVPFYHDDSMSDEDDVSVLDELYARSASALSLIIVLEDLLDSSSDDSLDSWMLL